VPLRQDLAVTGSINQKGEIQPVGGINSKIEGFYLACRAKGLTGRQGVIIPAKNQKNLMLKEDILEAVDRGEFNVYTINTVDEGLELLSGLEAGVPGEDGTYPEESFNARVVAKLGQYNEALRQDNANAAAEQGENHTE